MKAVIVDLVGNEAVALCNDGQFVKLKNEHYNIGQEIQMQPKVVRFPKQIAVAASFAIVLGSCGGVGTYAWAKPVSVVSLDINPSIEYSLNRFDRVISVAGKNNDGERIVDALGNSLKNTDITTALTITVEQLSTDAYLDADNTNYMVIGVYSKNDSKASSLKDTVDAFTPDSEAVCSIATVNVSEEVKETADSLGITGGKMELINEIASVATDSSDIDYATMTDLTVAQLEETKMVAASGTSVSEAVALASNTPETALASETKSGETEADDSASETKSSEKSAENSSSTKEAPEPAAEEETGSQVSNTTPADVGVTTSSGAGHAGTENTQPVSETQTPSSEGTSPQSPVSPEPSDHDVADAPTEKPDKGTSTKKNSSSSKKKNNGNGSSPVKGSETSEPKTEEIENTSESQQIQNACPSPEESTDFPVIEENFIYSELPGQDNTLV